MSRTRTEAQKQAEKKYEKHRELRSKNWCIIGYPESLPSDWLEYLEQLHVEILISPLHDDDVNPDGELKKPHVHILMMFDSMKSQTQVDQIAERLNSPKPQKVDNKRGMVRYLCHLDNPSKAQYRPEDVISLAGADFYELAGNKSDKYAVIREMVIFCKENGIVSFSALLDYASLNNETWFRSLCDNSAYVMKSYLKSAYWEKNN